jgi:hypothetical protein
MVRAAEPPACQHKSTKKGPYICQMETRGTASGYQQFAKNTLPKWKLKANWILRQYARIWCLGESPDTINFDIAFNDVLVQFLLDEGFSEKDAETCLNLAYKKYSSHQECKPTFSTLADKWQWIVKNGLTESLFRKFMSEEVIGKIFCVSRFTEKALDEGIEVTDFILQPWLHYEYYLKLPAIPPVGHEGISDPEG